MIITARLDADPSQFVRFTWNDVGPLTECSFVAGGEEANTALESLLAAKVHQGADLPGWTVTVA